MIAKEKWEVGKQVIVVASDINHIDKTEIPLKYVGDGYLEDMRNGHRVWFNVRLFPNVFEGMCLSLGLVYNMAVIESYEVVKIL